MTLSNLLIDQTNSARVFGDGFTAKTPIEGAARLGYLDAVADRRFTPEWEIQTGQWQRNYESGRQWAVAIRAIGLTPAEWPEDARVPQAVLGQLAKVRAVTGSGTRPDDTPAGARPSPDDRPVRAVMPVLVHGRIREVVTHG